MKCMEKRHIRWTVAAWALALYLTGCATLGRDFEKPQVHIAGIRMLGIEGFESSFQVDLRVINPNDMALPVDGVVCDLALNGHHLAKGVANPGTDIPAYGTVLIPVTIYASFIDMVGLAHRLIQGAQRNEPPEKWSYAINGQLDMGGAMWPGKLPFDAKGEIDLGELTGSTLK
ncbi:MAG: LEA type 2 family protein [Desulfobacterales bacterium]|nr:LEA type 2 family protein [Desulfobacterales bacterium]